MIDTYGRFPDRNALLARSSSPAEVAFLARGCTLPETPSATASRISSDRVYTPRTNALIPQSATGRRRTVIAESFNMFKGKLLRIRESKASVPPQ